jgi:hypothetical protein
MSDEQRKDQDPEVEAHRFAANDEPSDEAESEDDVEGHVRLANVRMDSPREA